MARPRRDPPPTEAELTRQTLVRLQEQMQQLTIAMQALAGQHVPPQNIVPPHNVNNEDNDEHNGEPDGEDNPFAGQIQHPIGLPGFDDRWEKGFKSEIPEFHGGSTAEELLDWIVTVDEILEFKRVPLDRCVPVITMRFRNRAAAWWTQLKTTRARAGKTRIMSWEKMKKHLRKTFLPFNYDHIMFQRLQNL